MRVAVRNTHISTLSTTLSGETYVVKCTDVTNGNINIVVRTSVYARIQKKNYSREILGGIAMAQISAKERVTLIRLDDFIDFIRNIESIHIQQTIECP